jgi:hypothetical protein
MRGKRGEVNRGSANLRVSHRAVIRPARPVVEAPAGSGLQARALTARCREDPPNNDMGAQARGL